VIQAHVVLDQVSHLANDQADIGDARFRKDVENVTENGFSGDVEKDLRLCERMRAKAGADSSDRDDGFQNKKYS
jgi:hypothetical protein